MDEDDLSEEANKKITFTAFIRQFKCCSCFYLASLVTGMQWVLTLHDVQFYQRVINRTVLIYAPSCVAVMSILTVSYSSHVLGRKKTTIGMLLLFVAPLLGIAATDNSIVYYGCALVEKFGRDMLIPLLTLYASEVSQARLRAFFIGIYFVAFYVGVFVARFVSQSYQTNILLLVVLDAVALGFAIMAPETPHYLVMTDRADKAEEVLRLLWADTGAEEADALLEKADLYADVYHEGIFPILISSRFAVPLAICVSYVMANYHVCDMFYKPIRHTAESYGYKYTQLLFTPVVLDIVLRIFMKDVFQIVGSSIFLLLCFWLGRRTLFFVSLFTSLCYGFLILLAPLGPKVLALVYTCPMWERFGMRQIGIILPTEIFPAVTRNVGISLTYLIHYAVHNQLHYMSIHKPYGTREIVSFIIFICFPLGIILIYLFMPETKDLPLTDTEKLGRQFIFQPLLDTDTDADAEIDEDIEE